YLDQSLSADEACYYIVKLLYIAKQGECERQLERFVTRGISDGKLPSMRQCEQMFLPAVANIPEINVAQHSLQAYEELMSGVRHIECRPFSGITANAKKATLRHNKGSLARTGQQSYS